MKVKIFKKFNLFFLIIVSILFTNGCKSGSDTNNALNPETYDNNTVNISKMDISDAKGLFISGVEASKSISKSSSEYQENKLFKVKEDGTIEEVVYYNSTGETITNSLLPSAIYKVNSEYTIITYYGYYSNNSNIYDYYGQCGFLVRTSDGAVFSLEKAGFPSNWYYNQNFANEKPVQTDDFGNIYYIRNYYTNNTSKQDLVKINVANLSNLTAEVINPESDLVQAFSVDKSGNVMFSSYINNDSNQRRFRIKTTSNSLNNISTEEYNTPVFWKGFDGNFYLVRNNEIKSISITSDSTIKENSFLNLKKYTYGPIYSPDINGYYVKDLTTGEYVSYYGNNNNDGTRYSYQYGYTEDSNGSYIKVNDNYIYFYSSDYYVTIYGYSNSYKFNLNNKTIIVTNESVYGINETSKTLDKKNISNFGLKKVLKISASDNNIFIFGENTSGKNVLIKLNPDDYTFETVISSGAYDIYNMSVSAEGIVSFTATRMSDSKKVIGTVDTNGNIETKVFDGQTIIALERIN